MPIIISLKQEKNSSSQSTVLRGLVRISEKTHHVCVDNRSTSFFGVSKQTLLKTVLEKIPLVVAKKSIKRVKGYNVVQQFLTFDESHVSININPIFITSKLFYDEKIACHKI